jgi:hypothetical protein
MINFVFLPLTCRARHGSHLAGCPASPASHQAAPCRRRRMQWTAPTICSMAHSTSPCYLFAHQLDVAVLPPARGQFQCPAPAATPTVISALTPPRQVRGHQRERSRFAVSNTFVDPRSCESACALAATARFTEKQAAVSYAHEFRYYHLRRAGFQRESRMQLQAAASR